MGFYFFGMRHKFVVHVPGEPAQQQAQQHFSVHFLSSVLMFTYSMQRIAKTGRLSNGLNYLIKLNFLYSLLSYNIFSMDHSRLFHLLRTMYFHWSHADTITIQDDVELLQSSLWHTAAVNATKPADKLLAYQHAIQALKVQYQNKRLDSISPVLYYLCV